jgi:hypothetical protein
MKLALLGPGSSAGRKADPTHGGVLDRGTRLPISANLICARHGGSSEPPKRLGRCTDIDGESEAFLVRWDGWTPEKGNPPTQVVAPLNFLCAVACLQPG